MATIIVDTTLDENDGSITDGDVSLRDALAAANSGDTITFASGAGEAFEAGGTIRLAQTLGELVISNDVTIDGDLDDDGAPDVTITGDTLGDDETTTDPLGNTITDALNNGNTADNVRVFNVTDGSSTIDGLILTGGFLRFYGGGVFVAEGAGLFVLNSNLSGNHNFGIRNAGVATLTNTTVSGNDGAISNDGSMTLINTTVSGNDGVISNDGSMTLTNTTVSGNKGSSSGGGISNTGTANLVNTTVSGNSATQSGGGIRNWSTGTLTLTNTIVLGNSAPTGPEVMGAITENGPNIVGGQPLGYVFASVGADPNTGVESGLLADNGGPVRTIALTAHPGNPALDAGQDDQIDERVTGLDLNGDGNTADIMDTDARGDGFPRTVNLLDVANNGANTVDLGALEVASLVADTAPTIVSGATNSVPESQTWAIDVETTDNFNSEGAGLTYTITGGADAALFNVDATNGVLTFVTVPDFEIPGDANGDNDYEVQVTVTDSSDLSDVQDIIIAVADVIMDQPQTFIVSTAEDELDDLDGLGTVSVANFGGADDLSLREAIAFADEVPFILDTITFASAPGEAFEIGGTIRLAQALGELVISSDVTIDGDIDDDGAPDVTIDAEGHSRVFNVINGSSTFEGLVITGGFADNHSGVSVADSAALMVRNSSVSGNSAPHGGAIYNAGTLMVIDTTVSSNKILGYLGNIGGGIFNTGTATLNNTTVSYNRGDGGIINKGTATLTDVIVSGNYSIYGPGGISNAGTLALNNTAVSGNRSDHLSGGIFNTGTAALTNTTVSGNVTRSGTYSSGGAGINNRGTLTLTDSTVSGNSVDGIGDGGGIFNSGTATIIGTTVSGNRAGNDGIAGSGGGIVNSGTGVLALTNTTVTGNTSTYVFGYSSGYGGGVLNDGVATLTGVTVSGNHADLFGGGIINSGTGTLTLSNTIVLGNSAPTDAESQGTIAQTGPNIIGGDPGDVFAAIDPATSGGLLADNGGPVQTIALRNDASNPALDAGQDDRLDEAVAGIDLNGDGDTDDVIDTDARGTGFDRRSDLPGIANNGANVADLGAFELANTTPSLIIGTVNADTITPGLVSAGVTGGQPLDGDDTVNALGGDDTVDGGGGADSIDGGGGNDSLIGGAGDDTLRGSFGYDTLDGGGGTDTADLSHTGAAATINLATGQAVFASGIETLIGIENAIGTNGDNFINGTGGANKLAGRGGDDTLRGGLGYDTLDGGAGNDTADLSHSASGATIDLVTGQAVFGGGIETLISIENAIGTNGNNFINGTGGANRLAGAGGDDTLRGGYGFDTLDGGAGTDTADLSHSASAATIDLDAGQAVFGGGVETLVSIENAIGTNGNNFINGTGGANRLAGAGGDDTLKGGYGFDTLDGGTGNDTADLSHSASGATIDLVTGQAAFGGGVETLISIENVIGTNGNNFINGTGGANRLAGGGGDDTLKGGYGFDTLDGGAGNDTADLSHSASGATIDLAAGQAVFGGGIETLISIENAIGTNGNNFIHGTGGANRLEGAGGDDTLKGGYGFDTLDGGAGSDTADLSHSASAATIDLAAGQVVFGGGIETLISIENAIGTGGNNFVNGTGGANTLEGGGGNDTLQGNGGPDRFFFAGTAFDRNTIVDFAPGTDKIVFDGVGNANDADDLTYTAGTFGGGGNQDIRITFTGLGAGLAGERIDVLDVGTDIDALKADILFV